MGKEDKKVHFMVDTMRLLLEIGSCGLDRGQGVLKVPLNALRIGLGVLAERAVILNDPILNECMINLGLYEMPQPHTPEFSEIRQKVKDLADKQRKKESKK